MYVPQVFDDFGQGLNLKSKADAVGPGEAINALNVLFTDRGAVQQRPGYEYLTPSGLTNQPESLHPYYTTSGTAQLLAGCGTRLEALNTSGAVVDSETGLTTGIWDFCRFGTPNSEVAYAGNGNNLLEKWNGTVWASVANTPKAGALCVTPTSNRMVATRFLTTTGGPTGGASTSSPSHVYFSSAGDPETWGSNDYVQLDPGDGEQIQAAIAWREYVFIFKESKFFVFTGESTDSDGTAIFNYRKVDTGVGLSAPRAVVANENGVYFVNQGGVYITTGAEPAKLSEPVDPVFLGNSSQSYFTGSPLYHARADALAAGVWQDLLLVSYPNGASSSAVLVYHTQDGWWSLWTLNSPNCFATFRRSAQEELVFPDVGATTKKIVYMDGTATSDPGIPGTVIPSFWRSGFHDFGIPEKKRLRQLKIWGSGDTKISVGVDYATSNGTATSLDFTSATNHLTPVLHRIGKRGTTFSVSFADSDTLDEGWSIHKVAFHIANARQTTVK